MSTSENKIHLVVAKNVARRFMALMEPYISKGSVAGSVRREVEFVHDIECVVVAKDEFSMGQCFPMGFKGLTINGTRLKKFFYPESGIHLELYITSEKDYGRMLAIRTGSSAFSHIQLAVRWGRIGWAGTEDGLRRKSECIHKSTWKIKPEYKLCPTLPPAFNTEEKFFAFIGAKWIPPQERSWVDTKGKYNYNV